MARTRSVPIVETTDELEQLRYFYRDTPEGIRLLFLAFLKEDESRTIKQAAKKTGISERRGRYWWDAYRTGGLQELLDRRVWKKNEYSGHETLNHRFTSDTKAEGPALSKAIAFMNAIAMNSGHSDSPKEWVPGFRQALISFYHDVDYVVVTIRGGIDVINADRGAAHILRQNIRQDKSIDHESTSSRESLRPEEQIIESGKQQGFPFNRYHFPPAAFNYFLDPGKRSRASEEDDTYIGTILLFRHLHEAPISQETLDTMERLRPFLVYTITDFIARSNLITGVDAQYERSLSKIASQANLTDREQRVLSLAFLGHSYQEIASLLFVSPNTVRSHIRAIYKKTGVSKLGEIYSKYLTNTEFVESDPDND